MTIDRSVGACLCASLLFVSIDTAGAVELHVYTPETLPSPPPPNAYSSFKAAIDANTQNNAKLQPGTKITIHPGIHRGEEVWLTPLNCAATAENPIVIEGAGPDQTILTGTIPLKNSNGTPAIWTQYNGGPTYWTSLAAPTWPAPTGAEVPNTVVRDLAHHPLEFVRPTQVFVGPLGSTRPEDKLTGVGDTGVDNLAPFPDWGGTCAVVPAGFPTTGRVAGNTYPLPPAINGFTNNFIIGKGWSSEITVKLCRQRNYPGQGWMFEKWEPGPDGDWETLDDYGTPVREHEFYSVVNGQLRVVKEAENPRDSFPDDGTTRWAFVRTSLPWKGTFDAAGEKIGRNWVNLTPASGERGRFFVDTSNSNDRRLYVRLAGGDSPASYAVEAARRSVLLRVEVSHVVVRGVTFEKCSDSSADYDQMDWTVGANLMGINYFKKGWNDWLLANEFVITEDVVVENCRFRHAMYDGLQIGGITTTVRDCAMEYNGSGGFKAGGVGGYSGNLDANGNLINGAWRRPRQNNLIEGNMIRYNGWQDWLTGNQDGNKIFGARKWTVRKNVFFSNRTAGLWLDACDGEHVIEGNVFGSSGGILVEISGRRPTDQYEAEDGWTARVENNLVYAPGTITTVNGFIQGVTTFPISGVDFNDIRPQIYINSSEGVTASHNTVVGPGYQEGVFAMNYLPWDRLVPGVPGGRVPQQNAPYIDPPFSGRDALYNNVITDNISVSLSAWYLRKPQPDPPDNWLYEPSPDSADYYFAYSPSIPSGSGSIRTQIDRNFLTTGLSASDVGSVPTILITNRLRYTWLHLEAGSAVPAPVPQNGWSTYAGRNGTLRVKESANVSLQADSAAQPPVYYVVSHTAEGLAQVQGWDTLVTNPVPAGIETQSAAGDPMFVSVKRWDLRLKKGSPASGRGVDFARLPDLDGDSIPDWMELNAIVASGGAQRTLEEVRFVPWEYLDGDLAVSGAASIGGALSSQSLSTVNATISGALSAYSLSTYSLSTYSLSTYSGATIGGNLTLNSGAQSPTAPAVNFGDYDSGFYGILSSNVQSVALALDGALVAKFRDNDAGPGVSGAFLVDNGSSSRPGYGFIDDVGEDTGMFWPSENQIGFATGGTRRMLISNQGVTVDGTLAVEPEATSVVGAPKASTIMLSRQVVGTSVFTLTKDGGNPNGANQILIETGKSYAGVVTVVLRRSDGATRTTVKSFAVRHNGTGAIMVGNQDILANSTENPPFTASLGQYVTFNTSGSYCNINMTGTGGTSNCAAKVELIEVSY